MTICRLLVAVVVLQAANDAMPQERMTLDEGVIWLPSAQQTDLSGLDPLDGIEPPTEEAEFDVLYRSVRYKLSNDTVTRTSLRVYRYNSEEAIRDYGTLRTGFDAASDTIEIARAMIVDSAGNVRVVDPNTVQVVPDDSFNVFSDYRYVVLPMTGIDVGSVAIVADVITTDRNKDIAPWGTVQYGKYGVPQGKVDLFFEWDSPDLKPGWNSQIEGMNCSESDASTLSCSVVDVPSYEIEDDVYYDDVTPQFIAAEDMSWQELADWYRSVFEPALTGHPSVAAKAAELAGTLEDEVEILRAMHDFVSKQVRYVGLEHGDWAYRPHGSDTTLARRYGDCKDKSALLIDLLRHRGINMSPVLVATTRKDPANLIVPTARYFDHLIVCGELSNGSQYCLDATDPYSGIEHLDSWIQGAAALHVDHASAPTALPADDYELAFRENLKLVVSDEGDLEEVGAIDYQRAYASRIRAHLTGMTSEELDKWALKDYHDTVSSLVDPEFRINGINETDADLTVSWTTTYDSLVTNSDKLEYSEYASWLNQSIAFLQTENEHYDYRFPGILFDSIVTLQVADKWKVERWSPNIDMRSRFGTFERTIEQRGNEVTLKTRFEAPKALVPAGEIKDFTKFLKIIRQEAKWSVNGNSSDQ